MFKYCEHVCVFEAFAVPEYMSPLMCVVGSCIVNAEVGDAKESLL